MTVRTNTTAAPDDTASSPAEHAPAAPAGPADQRAAPRRRVLKGGIVAYQNRHCTVPVTIRDISATGARLRSEQALRIPDTFELIIELDGLEVACVVVWRRNDEVVVRFTSVPQKCAPRRDQVVDAVRMDGRVSLRRKPVVVG